MHVNHKQADLERQGYVALDEAPRQNMPGLNALRDQHVKHDLKWGGVTAFRMEDGTWQFFRTPRAVPGFVDEPMLPKGS